MTFVVPLFLVSLIMGMVVVASNRSPYFAALGLVVVAGSSCGILVGCGGSFLPLVLFLIYLGGMLVVFAYSTALAAEPYPDGYLGGSPLVSMIMCLGAVGVLLVYLFGGRPHPLGRSVEEFGEFFIIRADVGGVAVVYSSGGEMLFLSGWVLLLTLFVVLELTRGLGRGVLRAVY
uniref:NADH-ubiquinone oxidoreductase chain 6 n=1 Tax=Lophiomus setigerus TaxID=292417 RepID=Q8HM68_LOPSE|nr:NADH dehydrogenase subunit 6 [Lophiomus setigerus]UIP57068.1 NADH dehydrogenase subunit 6 [Lophius litulon]BAC23292.1 NADH dehydrogenase subunit 6 [Lophiomus setigerus]